MPKLPLSNGRATRTQAAPRPNHRSSSRPVPRPAGGVSRRSFLLSSAGVGVLGVLRPRPALAQSAAPPATAWLSGRPVLTLVQRITQGFDGATIAHARSLGYDGYLAEQLEPDSIEEFTELQERLTTYDSLGMTPQETYDRYHGAAYVPVRQLVASTILRSVYSRKQLLEKMVQFWTDHFNVDVNAKWGPFFKGTFDRDVIRTHALGRFVDLLTETAKSAGMLSYLDNVQNTAAEPNENFARELLELHTLGPDGGQTEQDVDEVARCFTGWVFYGPTSGRLGEFYFAAGQHDDGEKQVLGHIVPAGGGVTDGETVLALLAAHPATAEFICTKLCRWFIGYEPPQAVVDAAKAAYLGSGGNIQAVLSVILSRSTLPTNATLLFKRPFRLAIGLIRATEGTLVGDAGRGGWFPRIAGWLERMQDVPQHWPSPNGPPHEQGVWGRSLLDRWGFAWDLFDTGVGGEVRNIDLEGLLWPKGTAGAGMGPSGGLSNLTVAGAISRALTGGALPYDEVQAIQGFIDSTSRPYHTSTRDWFSLAASLAGYQWY